MSDELRLPEKLAACEALLAAKPLAATGIDRDQLLYRAGWAAGAETARLARGRIAAWSFGSAAVAASLAVTIALQLRPGDGRDSIARIEDPVSVPPPVSRAAVEPRPTTPPGGTIAGRSVADPSAIEVETLLADFATGDRRPLAVRRPMRPSPVDVTQSFAVGDASYSPPAAAKTARQLLEEILPASDADPDSTGPLRLWPWAGLNFGEST